MSFDALSRLRPGSSTERVAEALGSAWAAPAEDMEGRIPLPETYSRSMSIRLDQGGKVGTISFFGSFPTDRVIEGLSVGMAIDAAKAARPGLTASQHQPDALARLGISEHIDHLVDGTGVCVRVRAGIIIGFDLRAADADFPKRKLAQADPRLTKAYDIWASAQLVVPEQNRGTVWSRGWALGRPPGIRTEQWPISPEYGYPLRHAFTLLLPEQYRVRGPSLVALSIFVDDQHDRLAKPIDWRIRLEQPRPERYEMRDELGTLYVAIWLTEVEFNGDLCDPPANPNNLQPDKYLPPEWLTKPYSDCQGFETPRGRDGQHLGWMTDSAPAAGQAAGSHSRNPISGPFRWVGALVHGPRRRAVLVH
jgi:hypothetical protein